MSKVTYRGEVEELIDTVWDVPESITMLDVKNPSGRNQLRWIESQHREKIAREKADAEREARQQEILNARTESQRRMKEEDIVREAIVESEKQSSEAQFALATAVTTAAASIVGQASVLQAEKDDWTQRHDQIVVDGETVVEDCRIAAAETNAIREEMVSYLTDQEKDREERFRTLSDELKESILTLVGPIGDRGPKGLPGSSVAFVETNPNEIDRESLGRKFFGRRTVPGDIAFVRQESQLDVYRTGEGKTWKKIYEFVNKQELISSRVNVLDQSTKSISPITIQRITPGGGGSGGEPLLSNQLSENVKAAIVDTSNWRVTGTDQDPMSGVLQLDITPLTGPNIGKRSTVVMPWKIDSSGSTNTEGANLDAVGLDYILTLTGTRQPAIDATGTASMVPGALATRLELELTPIGGATGDSYAVSGLSFLNKKGMGTAIKKDQQSAQPGWIWE